MQRWPAALKQPSRMARRPIETAPVSSLPFPPPSWDNRNCLKLCLLKASFFFKKKTNNFSCVLYLEETCVIHLPIRVKGVLEPAGKRGILLPGFSRLSELGGQGARDGRSQALCGPRRKREQGQSSAGASPEGWRSCGLLSLVEGKVDGDRPQGMGWWQLPLCQGQQQRAGPEEDPEELKPKNLFTFDF